MTLRYWLLLSSAAAAGLSMACSTEHSCHLTRTCPPTGGASSEADAGVGGEAGSFEQAGGAGPRATGGTSGGNGESDGGEGGEGDAPDAGPSLFGACSVKGAFACVEHASPQRLACDGEHWQAGTNCASTQLCDSSTGKCATIVSECASAKPGAVVCRVDSILTCGPDLVTADEGQACAGRCKLGACQAPVCGDEKVENGEDCDDATAAASGTCVKCKKPSCGDGVVNASNEQCDDGNLISGDGCSATCNAEPVELAAGHQFTCVRSLTGLVKCWGNNGHGALGISKTTNAGDTKETVPSKLPPLDLGVGRKAMSISTRGRSVCAVLDNGDLKCWGANGRGQLGTGDKYDLGDDPGEMGDSLKPVLLGGAKAISVSAGDTHSCAVLAGGSIKCWGSDTNGQLGQDHRGELLSPKDLPAIKLARPAVAVSASPFLDGSGSTCALLDNGAIQCWGAAEFVSKSSNTDLDQSGAVGDYVGEMSALPLLTFGTGRTAKSIGAANVSAAVLDDGSLRLWGTGGQLGQPELGSSEVGLAPAELASLPAVQFGNGKKVKSVSVSAYYACAVLDDGSLKCWGFGGSGELGLGSKLSTSDAPKDIPSVNLGGARAQQVATGYDHTCVILDNGTVKCWGNNAYGQLGLGDLVNRGSTGDKLSDDTTVSLSF